MVAINNLSNDLVWEIARNNSALIVRRSGVDLSRSPLNVTSKYTRVQEGLFNDKAVGIESTPAGLAVSVKKANNANKPAACVHTYTIPTKTSSRKSYRSVANSIAKRGYRSDLNSAAVARASGLIAGRRAPKADAPRKTRGNKAVQA